MHTFSHLVNAILVIVLLYIVAIILRKKEILKEDHSLILASVVTDLFLPAMIFTSLAAKTIDPKMLTPAFEMLGLEILMIVLAWVISVLLKFNRAQQGAIVFCSAFGSSTFLGYPLIMQMFPDQPEALTEAVLISEIGVGYPIFIIGPVLASYFGSHENDKKALLKSSLSFVKSPVFFALIAGILWSSLGLPTTESVYTGALFKLGEVLSGALTPVAILTVGLMFKLPSIKKIIIPLIIVVVLKLILKPVLGSCFASITNVQDLWRDVVIILAAMPPAVLGVVFLKRYGGDASLASALLLAASIISIATIVGVFYFMG